jgi:histidyl-tRNA synthetase
MKINSLRGMHDLLSKDCDITRFVENTLINLACRHGFEEIRTPILEDTNLFARTLGDCTDIITKEMYTFKDRNDKLVSLRPEGTAGVIRAGLQHGLFYNQNKSFWYMGPMFRRERPQKGRLRQFNQFGVEIVGTASLFAEIELICFCKQLWQKLNLNDLSLEINTLGNMQDRLIYRKKLIDYFNLVKDKLTTQEQETLLQNPLRLLDSKAPHLQEIIKNAPQMLECYSEETIKTFKTFTEYLDQLNIEYVHNTHLVRGLDYYNDIVFEWKTQKLGAQGTVCAGGRYNSLIAQLNNDSQNLQSYNAVGFAVGIERLTSLSQISQNNIKKIIIIGDNNILKNKYAFMLRSETDNIQIACDYNSTSIKSQLKKAIKLGFDFAVVLVNEDNCEFKYLKSNNPPIKFSIKDSIDGIKKGDCLNV